MTAVRGSRHLATRIAAAALATGALLAAAEALAQQPGAAPAPPAQPPAAAAPTAAAVPPAGPPAGAAAGAQILQTVCVMCHDQTLITSQRKSRNEWADTVEMMIGRGAPLTSEQAAQVVDYLAQNLGTSS